jgi:hypothetical protein
VNTALVDYLKVQGMSFNITCKVTFLYLSADTIKIEWQKEVGNRFTNISRNSVVRSQPKRNVLNLDLMFKNAPAVPKTKYRCVASIKNPLMERMKEATVTVQGIYKYMFIILFPTSNTSKLIN